MNKMLLFISLILIFMINISNQCTLKYEPKNGRLVECFPYVNDFEFERSTFECYPGYQIADGITQITVITYNGMPQTEVKCYGKISKNE
jgi:hypothetical protein